MIHQEQHDPVRFARGQTANRRLDRGELALLPVGLTTTLAGSSAHCCAHLVGMRAQHHAHATDRRARADSPVGALRLAPRRSRCSRNVRPRKGSSALGEPMREDSPAERMTAASMAAQRSAGARVFDRLVRQPAGARDAARCPAPHGDQFGGDADGDFLRRERADLQPHRRVHALELIRRNAFALERLIDRQHLALAADHADVARLGAHGPAAARACRRGARA